MIALKYENYDRTVRLINFRESSEISRLIKLTEGIDRIGPYPYYIHMVNRIINSIDGEFYDIIIFEE